MSSKSERRSAAWIPALLGALLAAPLSAQAAEFAYACPARSPAGASLSNVQLMEEDKGKARSASDPSPELEPNFYPSEAKPRKGQPAQGVAVWQEDPSADTRFVFECHYADKTSVAKPLPEGHAAYCSYDYEQNAKGEVGKITKAGCDYAMLK